MSRTLRLVMPAAALLFAGCASVDPTPAFESMQAEVAPRLGNPALRWDRGGPEDDAARAAVARLLERPLTADAAVQIALLNDRALQARYEALGLSQAALVQAGLLDNPSFGGELLTGAGGLKASVSVIQDFLGVVTLAARRTIAESELERAKAELGAHILDTAAAVRRTYYTVLGRQQTAGLLRQVVGATEAAAELAQRQALAGNASARDQALQQAHYAQATLELARLEAQIAGERERLNRALGLFGDQVTWNLPDRLPELPAGKPVLDGLESAAITHRLDLAGARRDVETARYTLELGRQLRWLSVLGLGVGAEREPDRKWLVGPTVSLSVPVFDQGQGRVAALEAQRRRSEHLLAALAVEVRAELREAYVHLVAAHDTTAFYRAQVLPLHQRIVADSQRLYNGMLIGVYELLRSRQEQITAARDYVGALTEYWLAHAVLEKALAGPLPPLSEGTRP